MRRITKLGEGLGGVVSLVEAKGQRVALKQLNIDQGKLTPEEVLENFKREFTTLKRLNHPHIVRIIDFGRDDEGRYFFTSEYIEGKNIFEATREWSPEEVNLLFIQVLRALGYLHRERIYHFDIKPQNILVTVSTSGEKIAKLIDFGLVAFRKEGILAGTPAYMAPENLLGGGSDGRADLYSLGITWYECLAGQNPFRTANLMETLERQRHWTPLPISQQYSDIPSYLDPIFEKILRKNPSERYHTAHQVIRDLNWLGQKNYPLETEATALAYIPGEGRLIGREIEWKNLLHFYGQIFQSHTIPQGGLFITGEIGTGKSRLLSELKYHAQLQGVQVLPLTEVKREDIRGDTLLLADNADNETVNLARKWLSQFYPYSIMICLAGPIDLQVDSLHKISLDNFDKKEVGEFVSSVLGIENPPDLIVAPFNSRSGGNPLYLTGLLQALIHAQQIFDEHGQWNAELIEGLPLAEEKWDLPLKLKNYHKETFSRLSLPAKKLLIGIAVSKTPLTRTLVDKLGFKISSRDWESLLAAQLVLWKPKEETLEFKNVSLKDWVSGHVDSSLLASVHQALGELFSQLQDTKEVAWYHLGLGKGRSSERFQLILQYAEYVVSRDDWVEALHVFRTARLFSSEIQDRIKASLGEVQALFFTNNHKQALDLLKETHKLLKENPSAHWEWVEECLREMTMIYIKMREFDSAKEVLEGAMSLMESQIREQVDPRILFLRNLQASIKMREGFIDEAARVFDENYKKWKSLSNDQQRKVLNNELGLTWLAQNKVEEAIQVFEEEISYYKKIGNIRKQAYAFYGLAQCYVTLEQWEVARKYYETCLNLSLKSSAKEYLFYAHNGLGKIAHLQNDWETSKNHYQHALELAQHLGDEESSLAIALNLAMIYRNQGDRSNASLFLRHLISILEQLSNRSLTLTQYLCQAYLESGRLNFEKGDRGGACIAYREAIRLIDHCSRLESLRADALLGYEQASATVEEKVESKVVSSKNDLKTSKITEKDVKTLMETQLLKK